MDFKRIFAKIRSKFLAPQVRKYALPISALLFGIGLALFLDSVLTAYFLMILSAGVAGFFIFAEKKGFISEYPEIRFGVVVFSSWCLFSIIYGLRALQVVGVVVTVLLGILASILYGWLWKKDSGTKIDFLILSIIFFEWFMILFFAPASFLARSAIVVIGAGTVATLIERGSSEQLSVKNITTTIIISVLLCVLFLIGFRWYL